MLNSVNVIKLNYSNQKITWLVFWITGVIGDGRTLLSIGGWTINGGAAEWWTAATEFITGAISTCCIESPIK